MSDSADPIRQRLAELEADPAYRDHPLMDELRAFAEQYFKLERQLGKMARIGDLIQFDLLEANAAFEQASLTDPLTGLPNRRALIGILHSEISRARREGSALVVALADVDHFKAVNDTYGHKAGDAVLKALGTRLRDTLRDSDHCGRWGGEEFLFVLPHLEGDAQEVTERIRQAVCSEPVASGDDTGIAVGLSFGVAALHGDGDWEDLVHRADAALYDAKRQGRNRSCRYAENG